MAERAAGRRVIREAEEITRQAPARAAQAQAAVAGDAAAIAAAAARMTSGEDEPVYACACVGPPPGCSLCFCHIAEEARARVEHRGCRWCEGRDDVR